MKTLLAPVLVMAMVVFAQAAEIRKSGECKLQTDTELGAKKPFSLTVGNDQIEAVCRFEGGDYFGNFAISAVPSLTNKSGKPISVSYRVAFLDKAGELVASISQGCDLGGNAKGLQLASALATIPKDRFGQITAYKMVIYLSDVKKKP